MPDHIARRARREFQQIGPKPPRNQHRVAALAVIGREDNPSLPLGIRSQHPPDHRTFQHRLIAQHDQARRGLSGRARSPACSDDSISPWS